jgi:hypothetical protein
MKQIIVLVSMVVLGIAIAGFVGDFKTSAETISTTANQQILNFIEEE